MKISPWHSIKTRVILPSLLIFVSSILSLSFYVSQMLQKDMQHQIGEQQFMTVSMLADYIDGELNIRSNALRVISTSISPQLMSNPAALQDQLEQRPVLLSLFNGGAFFTGIDGTALASLPISANRVGLNYMHRDFLSVALKDGKSAVSDIITGKMLHVPILAMAAPIRDASGHVIGAIVGVINLAQPNFLYKITNGRYGKTGGYLVVSQKQRVLVSNSDQSRIKESLPSVGTNLVLDRFLQGHDGYDVMVNQLGGEFMAAAKSSSTTDWSVVALLPKGEAFSPIYEMWLRTILFSIFLTMVSGWLMWRQLRQKLAPMLDAADILKLQSNNHLPLSPLPVTSQDEIGVLIASFNAQLETVSNREEALVRTEKKLASIVQTVAEGIVTVDLTGQITYSNKSALEILDIDQDEITGKYFQGREWSQIDAYGEPYPQEQLPLAVVLREQRAVDNFEHAVIARNGDVKWLSVNAAPIFDELGKLSGGVASFRDITEHKKAEEEQRIAATTFDTKEAILITDDQGNILRVNQAFQEVSGYRAEDVIGQNPRILQSGKHDKAFYQSMWAEIKNCGKWSGELWDRRKNGEIYPKYMTITAIQNDRNQVCNYVAVFNDITQRKQSEQEIHQLAFYDPLTHMPNRRLLMDRLTQAMALSMRNGRHGALLYLDLDSFKTVNDTKGHAVGDLLLIEVASRLKGCVREGDTVARLGGDEFIVLLEDLSTQSDEAATQIELTAEKIRYELIQPYLLDGFECRSSSSIGIAVFRGQLENKEDVFKHADVAMYQAKSAGRNCIRFFDPKMQSVIEARVELDRDLRCALENNEFRLYYQVQVDSLSQAIGAEVLLRWQQPKRGFVFPDQFIPLAEETGVIVPIGQWVMEKACVKLKEWELNVLTRDLTIAVNVSAKQFAQDDFVTQVQQVLLNTGANPSRLKLELTESTVLVNVDDTIAKMRDIKMLGVSFSMDDFGTGHSSLQYIKRLPLDQIKIDKSFVMDITCDPNDAAIVQAIIVMTDALGLNIIAEGVETEMQRDFLTSKGCHAFQGYLFSKPVPIEQFETWLTQRTS